jgi:hypothetical protein
MAKCRHLPHSGRYWRVIGAAFAQRASCIPQGRKRNHAQREEIVVQNPGVLIH